MQGKSHKKKVGQRSGSNKELSDLWQPCGNGTVSHTEKVLAIFVADLHFSHVPPIARTAEADWYETMKGYCRQLRKIKEYYDAPILCAGDIFDRWNSPAKLINLLLTWLPGMRAIPGNHDLPYHSMAELHSSAYWSLCLTGKVADFSRDKINYVYSKNQTLAVYAFPHGHEVHENVTPAGKADLNIALVHDYIWMKGHNYVGADKEYRATRWKEKLKGYDVAVFGDNHSGFALYPKAKDDPLIFNCGTFMRRTISEINYKPWVGLLYSGPRLAVQYLDTSQDKFIDETLQELCSVTGLDDLIAEVAELGGVAIDFFGAVKQALLKTGLSTKARKYIEEKVEEVRNARNT